MFYKELIKIAGCFLVRYSGNVQSFHIYGIIGSAIIVTMIAIFLIKQFKVNTIKCESVVIAKKEFPWGNVYEGLIFGVGWANNGYLPGPIFVQIGSRVLVSLGYAI